MGNILERKRAGCIHIHKFVGFSSEWIEHEKWLEAGGDAMRGWPCAHESLARQLSAEEKKLQIEQFNQSLMDQFKAGDDKADPEAALYAQWARCTVREEGAASSSLTQEQRDRIECNRQKALATLARRVARG